MILNCDYNDIKWDCKLKFDYENNSYGWPNNTMLSSYLLTTTSITFTVELTILEIYDKNDHLIPINQWAKYGVIDNTKELDKEFDLEFKSRHKAKLEEQQKMVEMRMKEIHQQIIDQHIEPSHISNQNNTGLMEKFKNSSSSLMSLKDSSLISLKNSRLNGLWQKQRNGIIKLKNGYINHQQDKKPKFFTPQVCFFCVNSFFFI